jgi:hypothetical protein
MWREAIATAASRDDEAQMKTRLVTAGAIAMAFVLVQAGYVWTLREEVKRLSRSVTALSSQVQAASTSGDAGARRELTARVLSARGDALATAPQGAAAAQVNDELRALVVSEMEKRREEERAASNVSFEIVAERARQAVTREVALTDVELARLEALGKALNEAEVLLQRRSDDGVLTENDLHEEHRRLWEDTSEDARRLLGEVRFAKLQALRDSHPEFARSLHALRPPPLGAQPKQENGR